MEASRTFSSPVTYSNQSDVQYPKCLWFLRYLTGVYTKPKITVLSTVSRGKSFAYKDIHTIHLSILKRTVWQTWSHLQITVNLKNTVYVMCLQRVYLVFNVGNWSPGDYNGGVGHISAERRSVAHWRVCKYTYVLISFYVRR